ncbi:rhomboid family intramembrane serine protease [Acinetobacter sp. MB5]|uniref:rhomboid family intramembrane serine protease n=1 Tax=Acinetobacter sp. MB5 TaxID=2069438 RepID=UPI000DCF8676|nr:rhomboid family intramembrane serine protease [Acinetobacter sp. MB5]
MSDTQQPSFYSSKLDVQLWWVTATLIAINVGLYLWQIATGVDPSQPSIDAALTWGADFAPLSFLREPARLFTSMFFHFGFLHLALNMWALYIFGKLAEQIFGHFYFLIVYLCCGLAGNLLSSWVNIHDSYLYLQTANTSLLPSVNAGASGAIMGLGSALTILSLFPSLPNLPFILVKRSLLLIMGLNLTLGMLIPNINNAAHLGGAILGIIQALVWYRYHLKNRNTLGSLLGLGIGIAILIASYMYCQHLIQTGLIPLWNIILKQFDMPV